MSYRISGLSSGQFQHLFGQSDEALRGGSALRKTVEASCAYPCRISLTDASPGDEVLLQNYEHLPVDTPYRSRHAIYIREGEETCNAVNQVLEQLRKRMLSVRGFDDGHMLVAFQVVDGQDLEAAIVRLHADSRIDYLHLHFADPGCYAARVDRV